MKILVNDFCGSPFQIQLSRALAWDGHTVLHTFFADNNTPMGLTSATTRDPHGFSVEAVGIDRAFRKHSICSRWFADVAYGEAISEQVRKFRPDLVLSSNMPLDGQRILLRTTREVQAKFVFWLQDLLSIGIEFVLRRRGVPLAGLIGRWYRAMEERLLSQSDAVVCIAPEFKERLADWKIPLHKTFVIENWAPLNEICPIGDSDTAWAREHGIAGKFCFMYSGTLGMKHKPELLLELVKRFEARDDVVTVVVAQGVGAEWLRQNAEVRPGSLLLLPFQPYERLSEVLGTADVLMAVLDADCGAFAVPSKTLAYLCARRPLLIAAPGANLAAQIVRRASAGEVVVDDDAESFVEAATRLFQSASLRQQYAANARDYAERTFAIEHIREQFQNVITYAMAESSSLGGRVQPQEAISSR